MRKKLFHRITAAFCILTLLLSLAPTAHAADGPAKSDNIGKHNYSYYSANTVKSYLFENNQGGLTRVEYLGGSSIVVEDYSSDFKFQRSHSVSMELSIWGGFYAGKDYNFFVFGQANPSESDSVEVIRVVKYSKDWQRLDQYSLYGANTETPFRSSSLSCTEYGGNLYIRTSHRMYRSSDGLNHQANMTLVLRQSDMSIVESYYKVEFNKYGYVSHSFNQFILTDQSGSIVAVDHGDAYPREIVLNRAGSSSTIQKFPGAIGDNNTGASLGGFAETSGGYVTAYNFDGVSGNSPRTVYLAYTDKSSLRTQTVQVSQPGTYNPILAPLGLDGGYIIWINSDNKFTYTTYSASGSVGSPQIVTAAVSDCQPIAFNGKAVWYVTSDSTPIFYTLDSGGVKRYPTNSADSTPDSTGTNNDSAGSTGNSNGTAGTPAAGQAFPDVPATHWASEQVKKCMDLGIVAGYDNGKFGPGDPVTGAQFATMLGRTFYAKEFALYSANANSSGGWYVPALLLASNVGMLQGTSHLESGRSDAWKASQGLNLTRLDMAMMLYNIIAANGKTPSASAQSQAQSSISDFRKIPSNYQTAVSCCVAAGVINGMSDGSFSGDETMTRAQACVVITRMLDVVNSGNDSGNTGSTGNNSSETSTPVSLAIKPTSLTLTAGESGKVQATASGTDSTPHIAYSSSNQATATVDSSGNISAKAAGSTVITAIMTWKGQLYTASCAVTVKAPSVAKVTLTPKTLELTAGESKTIDAQMEAPDGSIYKNMVSLTSSDPSVVEIRGYELVAKAPGTAVITGFVSWEGQTYRDTCNVTVKAPANSGSSGANNSSDFCAEVVRLVNEERAKAGLSPLGTFDTLTAAAQIRAPELITKFDHNRPDGTKCFTALGEAGVSNYYTAGENIAAGQRTPAEVVESWMNSPGHRANILNGDFTHIGVGYVQGGGNYGHYWVQLFVEMRGNPSGSNNTGTNTGTNTGSNTGTNAGTNTGTNTGSGAETNTGTGIGSTTVPANGRTDHYREAWANGNYLELQVVNGNTIQFSGCYNTNATYYNYAVLRVFGGENYTPFTPGVPFSVSVPVDVARLSDFYGGDTTKPTSYIISMVCQNYTPGDSSMGGLSFQSGVRILLALSASGGVELQVSR